MPNKNDEILLLLLENNPHNICDFSVHVKFYKKASEVQNFTGYQSLLEDETYYKSMSCNLEYLTLFGFHQTLNTHSQSGNCCFVAYCGGAQNRLLASRLAHI